MKCPCFYFPISGMFSCWGYFAHNGIKRLADLLLAALGQIKAQCLATALSCLEQLYCFDSDSVTPCRKSLILSTVESLSVCIFSMLPLSRLLFLMQNPIHTLNFFLALVHSGVIYHWCNLPLVPELSETFDQQAPVLDSCGGDGQAPPLPCSANPDILKLVR